MILEVEADGRIHFVRASIFYKVIAACDLARRRGQEVWFVHNSITLKADARTEPDYLFYAWIDAQRTDATEIGPDVDPLTGERLFLFLRRRT